MKLPFQFKNVEGKRNEWQWPSCKQPKTLSFRASDELIKITNSVYFDASDEVVATPDTWFATSSEGPSLSARSEDLLDGEESCEAVLQEVLQAERLFFDPDENRSIFKQEKMQLLPFEESVALEVESKDPYEDFRSSMEEMVETHGLREWESLDELLGWYLRMNGTKNHGFIVGAFVDLLVGIVSTSCTDSDSFVSCSSSPVSPLL